MLHCESDMADLPMEQPEHIRQDHTGIIHQGLQILSVILSGKQFGNDSLYYSFADTQLFNKTGMPDAVFEVDPSGTRVGSSYLYATARDYARFALLYQNDGVFNGERILPEGWVKYSTSAASASNGEYGAFFWLNRSRKFAIGS